MYPKDSVCGHFGAGDFLDFAGRAGSVVDLNALTQPQLGNVLLTRHLIGYRKRCKRAEHKTAEQQGRKVLDVRGGVHDLEYQYDGYAGQVRV